MHRRQLLRYRSKEIDRMSASHSALEQSIRPPAEASDLSESRMWTSEKRRLQAPLST